MILNSQYCFSRNNGHQYLVNIDNGDVYQINDVTFDILSLCNRFNDIKSLAHEIYYRYQDANENYSINDLVEFINRLVSNKIIIND